jgi:hypothetical protein
MTRTTITIIMITLASTAANDALAAGTPVIVPKAPGGPVVVPRDENKGRPLPEDQKRPADWCPTVIFEKRDWCITRGNKAPEQGK